MLNREDYKNELIRRYEYIYENSTFILAPYLEGDTLGEVPSSVISSIEEFLLGDIEVDSNPFYIVFKDLLKDSRYVEEVKVKLSKAQKEPDIKDVLDVVRKFIIEQNSGLKSKKMKLDALDEYYRISRYSNDGRVWTSGHDISVRDMVNFESYYSFPPNRNYVNNIGNNDRLTCGMFISFLTGDKYKNDDNRSILTEEEKQEIYLRHHDEMPWDYKVRCEENKTGEAPEVTKWCGRKFNLNEERVFRKFWEYFILCPNCGYMVNVPSGIFTEGVRARIDKRCSEDPNLFRKEQLASELTYLNNRSREDQKVYVYQPRKKRQIE